MSDVIEFLKKNKDLLKISTIEKAVGIPQSTIASAMSGRENRTLTADQEEKINKYLRQVSSSFKIYLSKKFGG